jgi:O-antigen/teichoic acid export membrane protein
MTTAFLPRWAEGRLPRPKAAAFIQSVVLFAARSAAAALTFATNLYLARRLGPDGYGAYAFVIAFVTFVSLFLDVGYFASGAKLLAESEDEGDRRGYVGALAAVGLAHAIPLTLLVAAGGAAIGGVNAGQFASILLAVAVLAPAKLAGALIEQVLKGGGRPGLLAAWTASGAILFTTGVALADRLGRLDPLTACAALLGSGLVATAGVVAVLRPRWCGIRERLARLRAEHRAFGRPLYLGRVVNVASYRTDALLLGLARGPVEVASYSLAMSMAGFVVFFSQSLTAHRFRDLASMRPIPRDAVTVNLLGILVVGAASAVIGELLVHGYLGPAYGSVAWLLAPALLAAGCQAAYQPYNAWLLANGRGRELRRFLLVTGAVNLGANVALIPVAGAPGAALASILGMATYLTLARQAYRRLQSGAA